MAVNNISGDGSQRPLQMLRGQTGAPPGPPPAVLQSLPQDSIGLGKQPSRTTSSVSSDRVLSDLSPEELASLKGGSALESLAKSQSSLTVGQARPLLQNPSALNSIAGLLEKRSDLKVEDFVSRDMKGRVQIDPSYKSEDTMKFLEERQDMNPRQLSAMRSNMTRMLKNPKLGKEASEKALNLMKERQDLSPEDVTKMMGRIGDAVGLGDKKQGGNNEMAGAAAMDMFDDASKLLKKRGSLHPDRVGDLIGDVGGLTSPEDKSRATNVATGFKNATQALEKNPLREPEELSRMASTIGDHFKGNDDKAAGARMNAFGTGAKMMGDHTHLDAQGLNTMLTKAKERNPKLKNPGQGEKLLGALNGAQTDLANGKMSVTQMSDPNFKPQDRVPTGQTKPKGQDDKKKQGQAQDGQQAQQGQQQQRTQAGQQSPTTGGGSTASSGGGPATRSGQ